MSLSITINGGEYFDESRNRFFVVRGRTIHLEHSLLSISNWETKWCKPFLSEDEKTENEMLDYIHCMTLEKDVDPNLYYALTPEQNQEIAQYINSPASGYISNTKKKGPHRKQLCSEQVYAWMVGLNIPFECEKWRFNRLMNLINICNDNNQPEKKMTKNEIYAQNQEIRAANERWLRRVKEQEKAKL